MSPGETASSRQIIIRGLIDSIGECPGAYTHLVYQRQITVLWMRTSSGVIRISIVALTTLMMGAATITVFIVWRVNPLYNTSITSSYNVGKREEQPLI